MDAAWPLAEVPRGRRRSTRFPRPALWFFARNGNKRIASIAPPYRTGADARLPALARLVVGSSVGQDLLQRALGLFLRILRVEQQALLARRTLASGGRGCRLRGIGSREGRGGLGCRGRWSRRSLRFPLQP